MARPHLGVVLVLACLVSVAVGCSNDVQRGAPAVEPTPSQPPTSAASPSPTASGPSAGTSPTSTGPTLTQIVHDPRSTLYAVSVRPGPEGYTVSAWWTLMVDDKVRGAIVTSDDRFDTASYEPGGWRRWARHEPLAKKVAAPVVAAFEGLLASPVQSLDPHIRAFVAGGDGATLLPFQAVARSVDGGSWRGYVVPKTHGDQSYVEGQLVLPDGRFLALLDAWSSDRGRKHLGPEYHGLWVSAGDDWATYVPFRPRFRPALRGSDAVSSIEAQPTVGRQAPHGLVVATTRDNLAYVSEDGGQTFHSVRAR